MRNKKRVVAQFTFHDRTGIQNYLERMALKGWMLDKISKWSWHFRRIEPMQIHFAVSYFAKTSTFEPEPPEELLRFREFCRHTGWQFCAEAAQMQIFYNEAEDPLPIETDAMLEIESIHKSIKKQQLPSYIVLLAVAVMNGWMRISDFIKYPVSFLRSNLNLFVMLSVLCLLLMIAVELGSYFLWRVRALKQAERDGSFLPTRGNRIFIFVLLYILIAAFALLIIIEWNCFISGALLISMGYYAAILLFIHGISDIMKQKKIGAGTNVTLTIVLAFVLGFAFTGITTWTVTKLERTEFFEEEETQYALAPDERYLHNGDIYIAQHHELPLYAADLYDHEVPDNIYSTYHYIERSILMTHHDCGARVRYDYDDTWPAVDYENITYFINDFNFSPLTDFVLDNFLSRYEHRRYNGCYEYRAVDAAPWSADEVWLQYGTEFNGGQKQPMDNYIIRWGDRLVELRLFAEPTQEQIAIIAEKLMP